MTFDLRRRTAAELIGTAGLLIAVVGSGVMGERLSQHNDFLTLLANSLATGVALVALIATFGPISGAHLNPAVSLVAVLQRQLSWSEFFVYASAQVLGAFVGVVITHLMFRLAVFSISGKMRGGAGQILSEFVATSGLLLVIGCGSRFRPQLVPFAVAAFITGAYWFTSSTSFANPAVTLARTVTDTFVGIRPADGAAFVLTQLVAAVATTFVVRWLSAAELSERPHNE
jgi:glycerol uptake facilitator-like aquaporin